MSNDFSAATPRPWIAELAAKRGPWIKGAASDEWTALACGDTDESAADNAALIVAAVNAYGGTAAEGASEGEGRNCPACDGKGTAVTITADDGTRVLTKRCGACEGTGWIAAPCPVRPDVGDAAAGLADLAEIKRLARDAFYDSEGTNDDGINAAVDVIARLLRGNISGAKK